MVKNPCLLVRLKKSFQCATFYPHFIDHLCRRCASYQCLDSAGGEQRGMLYFVDADFVFVKKEGGQVYSNGITAIANGLACSQNGGCK